jgi:Fe-S cluster assembly ATP-binding protein
VSRRIQEATDEDNLGVLAITHFARLLEVLEPDRVHVLAHGSIRASGGPELAEQLEAEGYAGVLGDAAIDEPETLVGLPHVADFGEDPFADPLA